MSNNSNANRFNSSRDRSFYAFSNTEGNTTKDTFLKNGSNIIMKDYNNFGTQNNSSLVGGAGNEGFNPYVMDSKIKDLESKITTLEQANKILIERINTNEQNFTLQLKQMEVNNAEERENRYKAEKTMNIISEQNNANSNDLNLKLNMLQERMLKGDETKTQQRQFDLESQKYLIGKMTEKITKIVKSEVEARYKADMDGKVFSQRLSNKFESSLDILKKEIEEITNQTRVEMQNISRECSERTHNVSKYIDQQIQDAVFGKGSSNEELKNFVRKLTEQVKNSLLSISKKHEMIEARLNNIEIKDGTNQNNNKNFMDKEFERLSKKIDNVKLYTEINMTKHDQFLEQNIKNITTKIEKNITFLAGQLIETRNKINERFEKIFEEHHGQYRSLYEDMEKICERLYKYEALLKKYEVDYNNVLDNVNKSLSNIYAREDVQIVHERIIKTIECNFLQEQINNIFNALQSNNLQFTENLKELNKGSKSSVDFLQAKINEQENKLIGMAESNLKMFEDNQKNFDSIISTIEVNQIVKEMITRVDNEISINASQQKENEIINTIQENKNEIMNSINEINITHKEEITTLKDKVNIIESSLGNSGQNMENLKKNMEKMKKESEELEMKESVNKIMDLMISNIENTLTKERMDKMSQFDLNKMRETIIGLEDKYNSLSNTNTELESIKENINQLTAEQEILKKKPKGGDDIKLATIQMLNNVEFDNIYSILNSGNIGGGKEEVNMKDYSEMVDNKINNAMEKIKNDNEETWIKCVQMKGKVTDPEEIRKILREIPAGVYSKEDSQKKILELSNEEENYALAKTNFDLLKNKNYDKDIYNYNNQQDPGPEINSKKSSKKSSKKGKTEKNNPINNQNDNNNINNEENKSKKSKGTNKSKNPEQVVAGEEKQSKKSKAPSQNKNSEKSKAEENKSNKSKAKSIEQPANEENKSNKSKAKSIEQQANEENKSKKSSKNNKVEPQNDEENKNPIQESNEEKKENPDSGEEGSGSEAAEEEEDDVEGNENEEYGGQLNATDKLSGKTPPNIKK